jgi:hypothetical protein
MFAHRKIGKTRVLGASAVAVAAALGALAGRARHHPCAVRKGISSALKKLMRQ